MCWWRDVRSLPHRKVHPWRELWNWWITHWWFTIYKYVNLQVKLLSVYYWTISNWLMIFGRWLTQKRARAGFAKCSRSFQLISLISFPAPIIIPANQCNRILQMPNHCHRLALMDFPNQGKMWPTLAQNLRYVATYISGSAVNPS